MPSVYDPFPTTRIITVTITLARTITHTLFCHSGGGAAVPGTGTDTADTEAMGAAEDFAVEEGIVDMPKIFIGQGANRFAHFFVFIFLFIGQFYGIV